MSATGASGGPVGADLRLEVIAGNAAGTQIEIEDRLVFGRHSEGAGQLGEDPELSRHHAQISRQADGGYAIEDLSSMNGTFVNGARVEAPAVLSPGDVIDLGATRLVVRDAPSATPPLDVRAPTIPAMGAVGAPEPAPEPPTEPAPGPPTEPARASENPPAEVAPPVPNNTAPDLEEAPLAASMDATSAQPPAEAPVEFEEQLSPPEDQPVEAATPPLDLRLSFDFGRGEAAISLGELGDSVRIRLKDGRWQIDSESS